MYLPTQFILLKGKSYLPTYDQIHTHGFIKFMTDFYHFHVYLH